MIIGTCSICGGPVSTPDVWYGVNPPVPTCDQCGATKADHGPIVNMRPAPGVNIYFTETQTDKK